MDYTSREYWNGVMNASLCKFLILHAVCREPLHGYAVARRVAEATRNLCAPTEGTVYPALRDFERSGCVRSRIETRGGRERRVYAATPKGRKALAAGADAWRRGLARLAELVGPPAEDPDPRP